MKAIRSNRNISPHGGAVPILKKIKEFGIPQVIRKCLGKRVAQSKYGYEDIFISWVLTSLCGGMRIDHITKLRKKLSIIPGLKIPSHDTLGRVMKSLATETTTQRNISDKKEATINYVDYNHNLKMNEMLVKATTRMGALKKGRSYTLDIDATFLSTECRGARRRLNEKGKMQHSRIGFSPFVCLIQDLPIYISMRNGNAAASFQIYDCVQNCLKLIEDSDIKIGRVISDGAGYHKKTMAMLDDKGIKFNIRFGHSSQMLDFSKRLKACNTWRTTQIETANFFWDCEIADIEYTVSKKYFEEGEPKTYRVVAIRIPTAETRKKNQSKDEYENRLLIEKKLKVLENKKLLKEGNNPYIESHWKEIDGYEYKFYITNDYQKTSEGIVREYNKRGNAERKFSFMKNDFGWRLPPFMNMNENAVFIIAAALANNIFRSIVMLFKKEIPELRLNARLREFQFVFIDVACEYFNKQFIFYNTNIAYEKIT